MDAGDPRACIHMDRRTDRRLAAASFLILFFAVVPGMAYTGAWSGPEGDLEVIVAKEAPGAHEHHGDGHTHSSGVQQCRVGPSKCTGQPSFVSTTTLSEEAWIIAPPSLSHELFGPVSDLAFQGPVYRMKPPPREV